MIEFKISWSFFYYDSLKCMVKFLYLYLNWFMNKISLNVNNHNFWKTKNQYAAPLRIGAWNDHKPEYMALVIVNLKIKNKMYLILMLF